MPRPLFLIGNKRSGTSLVVRLLNLHPRIFVTHESDVIWLLYQARNSWPEEFKCYPWDGPLGLANTIKACKSIIKRASRDSNGFTPADLFTQIQLKRLKAPTPFHRWRRKNRLSWLGDKKPVQQCDPEIRPFMQKNFQNARYIHIVRNPWAAVGSMIHAAHNWKSGIPEYWHQGPQEILARWTIQEQWAIDAEKIDGLTVHRTRLEDLVQDPKNIMSKMYQFLGVDPQEARLEKRLEPIDPQPNKKYQKPDIKVPADSRLIMDYYDYQ